MLDDVRGVVKAPPSARPGPGKRRPQPRSLSRGVACPKHSVDTAGNCSDVKADVKEIVDRCDGEELVRLQCLVIELTLTCDQQSQELVGLRSRVAEFESSPRRPELPGSTEQPRKAGVEQSVQTLEASEASCQREQWDAIHREAGDKTRDLRKTQESVRLLQNELSQQRLVAEQYRGQVEVLEEQLIERAATIARLRSQPCAAEAASTLASAGPGTPRGRNAAGPPVLRSLSTTSRGGGSSRNLGDASPHRASPRQTLERPSAPERPRSATLGRNGAWQRNSRVGAESSSSESESGDDT